MTEVITSSAIGWALAAGFIVGASALTYLAYAFPAAARLPLRMRFTLTLAVIAFIGVVFYTGQVLEGLQAGDPDVGRVVARAVLFVLYAAGMAAGHTLTMYFAGRRT